MRTLVYKSDEGCRKGCHPVNILRVYGRKIEEDHYFSVDEPGSCEECAEAWTGCWGAKSGETILFEAH